LPGMLQVLFASELLGDAAYCQRPYQGINARAQTMR
jgi:hypothetical protein